MTARRRSISWTRTTRSSRPTPRFSRTCSRRWTRCRTRCGSTCAIPKDLFLAQVNNYRLYHITDPVARYNQEDVWNFPTELFGENSSPVPVQPYYVIMRLPGESKEEFVLIMPLTPARRAEHDRVGGRALRRRQLRQARNVPFPHGLARVRAPAGGVAYRPGPGGVFADQPMEPVRIASDPRQPADDPDRQREPVRRAYLSSGRDEPAAGVEARRGGQRQSHRHGTDAGT